MEQTVVSVRIFAQSNTEGGIPEKFADCNNLKLY